MIQKRLGFIIVLLVSVLVILTVALMWLIFVRDYENVSLDNGTPTAVATTFYEQRVLYYLETSLDFLLGRVPSGYIWGDSILPINPGMSRGTTGSGRLIEDEELSDMVNQIITYEIIDIQIDNYNRFADASIRIRYPDVYTVMNDVAENLSANATVEELMHRTRQAIAQNEYEIIDEVISVTLSNRLGWLLRRNEQLDNALSGNVLQAYLRIMEEIIFDFMEGASHD